MKKIILAILCLSMAACSSFNVIGGSASADAHSQDVFLELVSYIPSGVMDFHPPEIFGTQLNFFDYERMEKDFDLQDLRSSDPWEEKLHLVIGYEFEGLDAFPYDLDFTIHDFYGIYGFDLADLKQSIFLVYQDAAVLRGVFDTDNIDQALLGQGYVTSRDGNFSVYTNDEKKYQFGISEEIILIGRSTDDLGAMIWQNGQPETSMAELKDIQQLVGYMHNVHGMTLFSSGDLPAIDFHVSDLYVVAPHLEEYGFKDYDQFREDWTYAMLTYHMDKEAEVPEMDFYYLFPSEELAEQYVPIVEDSLTNTPSLRSRHYPLWSELITLEEVEQIDAIVHANATTDRKHIIGNSFSTHDYYGLLPVREIGN